MIFMKEEFRYVIIGKVKRAVRQSMPRISPSIKQKSRKLGILNVDFLAIKRRLKASWRHVVSGHLEIQKRHDFIKEIRFP